MAPCVSVRLLARLCRQGELAQLSAQLPLPHEATFLALLAESRLAVLGNPWFNALLAQSVVAEDWRAIGHVCRAMQHSRVTPDQGTFQALHHAFSQLADSATVGSGGPLVALVDSDGLLTTAQRLCPDPGRCVTPLNPRTFDTLLSLYPLAAADIEVMHHAHRLERTTTAWEALVTAFGRAGNGGAVQRLHNEQWLGLWPVRPESLCNLARAYAHTAQPDGVADVHQQAVGDGFVVVERLLRRYMAGGEWRLLAALHTTAQEAGLKPRQATAQFIARGLEAAAQQELAEPNGASPSGFHNPLAPRERHGTVDACLGQPLLRTAELCTTADLPVASVPQNNVPTGHSQHVGGVL
eukprot:GGOE01049427.1.p1 GENE.GGOE01049427.1~~GGOE01049427.1.p1  ORF type:complete len:353 (-),score=62.80 GGOE01049427.1:12-1070(-)